MTEPGGIRTNDLSVSDWKAGNLTAVLQQLLLRPLAVEILLSSKCIEMGLPSTFIYSFSPRTNEIRTSDDRSQVDHTTIVPQLDYKSFVTVNTAMKKKGDQFLKLLFWPGHRLLSMTGPVQIQ